MRQATAVQPQNSTSKRATCALGRKWQGCKKFVWPSWCQTVDLDRCMSHRWATVRNTQQVRRIYLFISKQHPNKASRERNINSTIYISEQKKIGNFRKQNIRRSCWDPRWYVLQWSLTPVTIIRPRHTAPHYGWKRYGVRTWQPPAPPQATLHTPQTSDWRVL